MTTNSVSTLWRRPATREGLWAVGLAVIFIVMFFVNGVFMSLEENTWWQQQLLPYYGILLLLCGLSAGILGLIAIIRKGERSWMVWVTILPMVFVLFLVIGEFVGALLGFGH